MFLGRSPKRCPLSQWHSNPSKPSPHPQPAWPRCSLPPIAPPESGARPQGFHPLMSPLSRSWLAPEPRPDAPMGFSYFSGDLAPRQGTTRPMLGHAFKAPSLEVRYSPRSLGSRILTACKRSATEVELPGPAAEAANPHALQSARRHKPRGAKPRNEGCSTASPARPFPRRGVERGSCKQDPSATNGGTRTHPWQQADSFAPSRGRAGQTVSHGNPPSRTPSQSTAEADDRRPVRRRAGLHEGVRHPNRSQLGEGTSRTSLECRGTLAPSGQGGSHGSEEPRRREATHRCPKTPAYKPYCR